MNYEILKKPFVGLINNNEFYIRFDIDTNESLNELTYYIKFEKLTYVDALLLNADKYIHKKNILLNGEYYIKISKTTSHHTRIIDKGNNIILTTNGATTYSEKIENEITNVKTDYNNSVAILRFKLTTNKTVTDEVKSAILNYDGETWNTTQISTGIISDIIKLEDKVRYEYIENKEFKNNQHVNDLTGMYGWKKIKYLPKNDSTAGFKGNTFQGRYINDISFGNPDDNTKEWAKKFNSVAVKFYLFTTKDSEFNSNYLDRYVIFRSSQLLQNLNNTSITTYKELGYLKGRTFSGFYNREGTIGDPLIGYNVLYMNKSGEIKTHTDLGYTSNHYIYLEDENTENNGKPPVTCEVYIKESEDIKKPTLKDIVIEKEVVQDNKLYKIIIFKNDTLSEQTEYEIEFSEPKLIDIFLVGGGGAGSESHGGGGGAGSVVFMKDVSLNNKYRIKVGDGGYCLSDNTSSGRDKGIGLNGHSSEFINMQTNESIFAQGGGGGGGNNNNGGDGGSGGGADAYYNGADKLFKYGGKATKYIPIFNNIIGTKYGMNGGDSFYQKTNSGGTAAGAGGGGGGATQNGETPTSLNEPANGGSGIFSVSSNGISYNLKQHFSLENDNNIGYYNEDDDNIYFAGGGGGAYWHNPVQTQKYGYGGIGGGGDGGDVNSVGSDGINNTGGGGGGGGDGGEQQITYGGKGGSGIIIIKYLIKTYAKQDLSIDYKNFSTPYINSDLIEKNPFDITFNNINFPNTIKDYGNGSIYFKFVDDSSSMSWQQIHDQAITNGNKIPTKTELLDYLAKNNNQALYPNTDIWVPVIAPEYTNGKDWIQIGDLNHKPATLHTENLGSYPSWGDTTTSYAFRRLYIEIQTIDIYVDNTFYGITQYDNGKYKVEYSSYYNDDEKPIYLLTENTDKIGSFAENNYISDGDISSYSGNNYIREEYKGDWVKINLPYEIKLTKSQFITNNSLLLNSPYLYEIYGSNNNSHWYVICERSSNPVYDNNIIEDDISNSTYYNNYAFCCKAIGNNASQMKFVEWKLFGSIKNNNISYSESNANKTTNLTGWNHVKHISHLSQHWYTGKDYLQFNVEYGEINNYYNNWSTKFNYEFDEVLFVKNDFDKWLHINYNDFNLEDSSASWKTKKSIMTNEGIKTSYRLYYNTVDNNVLYFVIGTNDQDQSNVVYVENNSTWKYDQNISYDVYVRNSKNPITHNKTNLITPVKINNTANEYYTEFIYNNFDDIKSSYDLDFYEDATIDILVVGGGGSGGSYLSGGGGGGSIVYQKDLLIKKGIYNLNVGKGGNIKDQNSIDGLESSFKSKLTNDNIIADGGTSANNLGVDSNIYINGNNLLLSTQNAFLYIEEIKAQQYQYDNNIYIINKKPNDDYITLQFIYDPNNENGEGQTEYNLTLDNQIIADILIVAGGGGGGQGLGGGGGAGGVLFGKNKLLSGDITIKVGKGGDVLGLRNSGTRSEQGKNSEIIVGGVIYTINGGGGGTARNPSPYDGDGNDGGSGGSGGGAGHNKVEPWNNGGLVDLQQYYGWESYGNKGGFGKRSDTINGPYNGNYGGGGGGGAGSAGEDGGSYLEFDQYTSACGGEGGMGITFPNYFDKEYGDNGWFAGGGGGNYTNVSSSLHANFGNGYTIGQQKFGGGGRGGYTYLYNKSGQTYKNGIDGQKHTGGGGGGGNETNSGVSAGKGGSGIVLLRLHKNNLLNSELIDKYSGISNSGKSGSGASIIPRNLYYNSNLQTLIRNRRNEIFNFDPDTFDNDLSNDNIEIKQISVLNNATDKKLIIDECLIFKYIDPDYEDKSEVQIYNITKSKEFNIKINQQIECDFLIVAGGGGGGFGYGGGGGGGNVIIGKKENFSGDYKFVVGNGGYGAPSYYNSKTWPFGQDNNYGHNTYNLPYTALSGHDSYIMSTDLLLIAKGGGYGGSSYCNKPPDYGYSADGGCGGGRSGLGNNNRYNITRPSKSIMKKLYSDIIWEFVGNKYGLEIDEDLYINNSELITLLTNKYNPDGDNWQNILITLGEYNLTNNTDQNIYITIIPSDYDSIEFVYKRKKLDLEDNVTTNLVSRYLFEDSTDIGYDSIIDSEGNGNHLIPTNCTISTLHIKTKSSLFLNSYGKGNDSNLKSYIEFPSTFNLYNIWNTNELKGASICFWYRITWLDETKNSARLINFYNTSDTSNNVGIAIGQHNDSSTDFCLTVNNVNDIFQPHSGNIIDGEWHFMVVNIKDDINNHTVQVLIDGVEKVSESTGAFSATSTFNYQYIGRGEDIENGYFVAYYNDFRVYSQILDTYQIDQIYENRNVFVDDGKKMLKNNIYIYGNRGGGGFTGSYHYAGGGGGAGERGYGYSALSDQELNNGDNCPHGGKGIQSDILGINYYWAGGGGGGQTNKNPGNGGLGGGGAGASYLTGSLGGKLGYNLGENSGNYNENSEFNIKDYQFLRGSNAGAHTGSGGGGGRLRGGGGKGGSGIIVLRYKYEIDISEFIISNTNEPVVVDQTLNKTSATGIFENATKYISNKIGGKSDVNKWSRDFNININSGIAGGGAGAISEGKDGIFTNQIIQYGDGGNSIEINIKNEKSYYGGGGGGGAYFENIINLEKQSLGGFNSGGKGGVSDNFTTILYPTAAIQNCGGGGGGGDKKSEGREGANGVIIIRYKTKNVQTTDRKVNTGLLNYSNDNKWNIVEKLPLSLLTIPEPQDENEYPVFLRYNFTNSVWETKNIASETNFTGQHKTMSTEVNISLYVGYIVCSDNSYHDKNWKYGKNNLNKNIDIIESLPYVKLSERKKEKSVIGVISNKQQLNINDIDKQNDNEVIINSLGEGAIWVSDINGPLSNGDYITTSDIKGIGMVQDDDLLHNYTVAKITMNCDFKPRKIPVEKYVYVDGKLQKDKNGRYMMEYELDENGEQILEKEYITNYINKDGELISEQEYVDSFNEIIKTEINLNTELKTYVNNIETIDIDSVIDIENKFNYLLEKRNVFRIAFVGCTYHCG